MDAIGPTPEPRKPRLGVRRALAEFAVIVTGILTALAVDGWASRRKDATLEREYLGRLRQELVSNLEQLERSKVLYTRVEGRTRLALEILSDSPPRMGPVASLVVLYDVSRGGKPEFLASTYQDLVTTGGLRLFRDMPLRSAIISYYEDFRSFLEEFGGWDDRLPYRNRVRRLIPADVQTVFIESCPVVETLDPGSCEGLVAPQVASQALNRVKADPELQLDLVLWAAAQANLITITDDQLEDTEDLLRRIGKALPASDFDQAENKGG